MSLRSDIVGSARRLGSTDFLGGARSRMSTLRGRDLLVLDLLSGFVALYLAVSLRFDAVLETTFFLEYLPVVLLPLAVRPLVNDRFGLYRRMWRYASVGDLHQIFLAILAGTGISILVFYLFLVPLDVKGTEGFPRTFWVLEPLLSLALMGGSRFLVRSVVEWHTKSSSVLSDSRRVPTLLYGAGQAGVVMARSASRESRAGVRPVGFLDDNPAFRGNTVAGLPVFGDLRDLPAAIGATDARMLLITMPSADGRAVRRVMNGALAAGLDVRTVPPVHELLDGSVDAFRVRRVRVEDLLGRPIVTQHADGVQELIRDKVVLVTGGGGSIGSELARQVYALRPRRLILVDRAESPLYSIHRELEVRELRGRGGGELDMQLANVASRAVMARIIRQERPDIVFHAAAYKHVPMMETHPSDGVHVNLGGTLSMLEACEAAGTPRFVFVSTDKAVEPTSVMGATKRLAESLVADSARRTGRPFVSVRFGNVLGSNGSVVPIFQQQLEHGEPLTITHPEMTRYFMTISEAGWLILDAAALGNGGDLFVLDMGEPVRIMDLARDLIRLSGRDVDSVPIEITGLRPGEKLHERLFYDAESVVRTDAPKVFRAMAPSPPLDIRDRARRLLDVAAGDTDDVLRERVFALVDELIPGPAAEATRSTAGSPRVDVETALQAASRA